MNAEILFGTVVFLVLVMIVVLVFMNMSSSLLRPKSLPRPQHSYPDVLPAPPAPHVVQGVNTAMIRSGIHDQDATTVSDAILGHRDFVASMNLQDLSEPALGTISGNIKDNSGKFAPVM